MPEGWDKVLENQVELRNALEVLSAFQREPLTAKIAAVEAHLLQRDASQLQQCLKEDGIGPEVLTSALVVKKLAGEINVVIHALGILATLPRILEPGERIEFLSLGAGNTGRPFDLETDRRIAEFKFIMWKGGPESIRQNTVFKDFFELAEAETAKRRYLYVVGLRHPIKFLHGSRALNRVLSKNNALRERFYGLYGKRFGVVREYFDFRADRVHIVDLTELVPELRGLGV